MSAKVKTTERAGLVLVTTWMPKLLVQQLDAKAKAEDSDRSKFVRNAVRERLARNGVRS